ncbi:hypothetical protein EYR40_004795 [Pleurotus pulmonarius]|nr:hypothetical protein EYR36_006826 [Pleurotus pulmonarius]KAF4601519.1 hypothetical protein EYR38_006173 [Pleurotus pulmonarius]KAF4601597.1 hypothetical protein EYR40_004795 [Pleurotus pulmonarius]
MYQSLIFNHFPLLSGRSAPRPPRPVRIHHLPIELLQLIFEEVVAEFDENSDRTPTFLDAHELGLVCRSWRTIVLNTPILWSVIDTNYPPEVLDLSFQRASGAPLTLYLDPRPTELYDTPIDTSWKLYQRIHLFKSFNSRPRFHDWHILRGHLRSAAPLLESLKISMYSYVSPVRYLPKNMFGGVRPPRLRELLLRGFHIPWGSHLLQNLTVLELEAQNRPTYTSFIQSLQNMPSLQKLSLNDSLPSDVEHGNVDVNVVSLPKLRIVKIKDNVGPCTLFLQYVKLSFTHFHLHLQAPSLGETGGSEALFQALSTHLHVDDKGYYMDRFILHTEQATPWSGQICRIVGSLPCLGNALEDVDIDIALQTYSNEESLAVEYCLTCALRHLNLRNVSELALCVPIPLSYSFWMVVLPTAFPTLSEIAFTAETMTLFFDAYAEFFRSQEGRSDFGRVIPFKRLKRITCDLSRGFGNNVTSVLDTLEGTIAPWTELVHEKCCWKLRS